MEGHHHHHHNIHHQQQQQQQYMQQQQMSGGGGAGLTTVGVDTGDRFPQWSSQETKEFLIIRAELDRNFMETKRNKLLWEVISTKMREKGFNRSSEQCKCKWKNLVTRYKGCETMEAEGMRQQFPYYNEMQGIFTARMQRMLWAEEEGGSGPGPSLGPLKKNKMGPGGSSDEEEEEGNNTDGEKGGGAGGYKKKKSASSISNKKAKVITPNSSYNESSSSINAIREMMEEYMKAEMERETQWREEYEAREEERRRVEREWRERMEGLERERMRMETIWREKEEQRKMREEVRAEKRDALITTLLNKLRREDSEK